MMISHVPRSRVLLAFGLIVLISFSFPVWATGNDVVIVKVTPGTDVVQLSIDHQAILLESIAPLSLHRLQGDAAQLLITLAADPRVVSVQWDAQLEARPSFIGATGDELEARPSFIGATGTAPATYTDQEAVWDLRLPQAQALTTGQNVTVAVLDTGVDMDHPLLAGQLVPGYDFVDNDSDPYEEMDGLDNDYDGLIDEAAGHGTHVAGVITLVAPDALIMPVRIFDTDGSGTYFAAAAGIVYAVDQGAQVINLSGNGMDDVPFLQEAVNYAWQQGVVIVAAGGINQVGYPAQYAQVVSVGAVDHNDYRTDFAHFQDGEVMVYAPGTSIYSAYFDDDYAWWTGHSMATPFVAGEAALMAATGTCNYACVMTTIPQASRPVHTYDGVSRYRIDVYDAVAMAANQHQVDLQVTYRAGASDTPTDQMIKPFFKLVNEGNSVALDDLTLRYWYEEDAPVGEVFECDYAVVDCSHITAVFSQTATSNYVEVGFTGVTQPLFGGGDSGEMQLRFHKIDWSVYDENDDYSYAPVSTYAPWDKVTLYYNDALVWGYEPGSAPPPSSSDIRVQYRTPMTAAVTNQLYPHIQIVNESAAAIPLEELTIKYWFPETAAAVYACDYATVGCSQLTSAFTPTYMELGFAASAGAIPAGSNSGPIQLRVHRPDWTNYNQSAHHSFSTAYSTFADWDHITLYHNGTLIWGIEP